MTGSEMCPLVWRIRSTDPYNRIGKTALQDVYDWRDRGLVNVRFFFEQNPAYDLILITKKAQQ